MKPILNPASGFLTGYGYTLNPYVGCSYACAYCYVRKSPVALFRGEEWGTWVDVKEEAAERLRKDLKRARKKGVPVTIFMASSTDPYQPTEAQEKVTRSLLEVMAEEMPDFLFVQTRSPLVARDVDLFQKFGDRIRVSVTVETDLEPIRKAFSPAAPPIPARLNALRKVVTAGVPAQATIAPMLPSSPHFAKVLAEVGERVCLDDYFMGDGSNGRRTEQLGIRRTYEELGLDEWYSRTAYERVLELLRQEFREDQILISKEGFLPS